MSQECLTLVTDLLVAPILLKLIINLSAVHYILSGSVTLNKHFATLFTGKCSSLINVLGHIMPVHLI